MLYDVVKKICKEKGVSIAKLERDLKFSTGSVCKWNESSPNFQKILKVAEYLDVPISLFKFYINDNKSKRS